MYCSNILQGGNYNKPYTLLVCDNTTIIQKLRSWVETLKAGMKTPRGKEAGNVKNGQKAGNK